MKDFPEGRTVTIKSNLLEVWISLLRTEGYIWDCTLKTPYNSLIIIHLLETPRDVKVDILIYFRERRGTSVLKLGYFCLKSDRIRKLIRSFIRRQSRNGGGDRVVMLCREIFIEVGPKGK